MEKGPRRIDRQRRERIVDAAIEVLASDGLAAMTHRRVAAAGNVPLAATTYYFSTLEELVDAALVATVERDVARLAEFFDDIPDGTPMAGRLAGFIRDAVDGGRDASVVSIELYSAAVRRQNIRVVTLYWEDAWIEAMTRRTGPIAARAVVAAMNGLLQRGLLQTPLPKTEELEEVIAHILRE